MAKRRTVLSPLAQRLTMTEVCQLWFRRALFMIPDEYPDFPSPAPDGLFLLDSVKAWFQGYHGVRLYDGEEAEALRIARGSRPN